MEEYNHNNLIRLIFCYKLLLKVSSINITYTNAELTYFDLFLGL